nr:hypothetical transcript [Hymenolepis microstoma]
MTGDVGESMLMQALYRYWKRGDYLEETFTNIIESLKRGHRFSVNLLETVLDATKEILAILPLRFTYLKTVYFLLRSLEPEDLSNDLLNRVMQFTLDAVYKQRPSYSLLRLLMNKYKALPDGTYRNVESEYTYIQYLMGYIEEMCLKNKQRDIMPDSVESETEDINENPQVFRLLSQSLARSPAARRVYKSVRGLTSYGVNEDVSGV